MISVTWLMTTGTCKKTRAKAQYGTSQSMLSEIVSVCGRMDVVNRIPLAWLH